MRIPMRYGTESLELDVPESLVARRAGPGTRGARGAPGTSDASGAPPSPAELADLVRAELRACGFGSAVAGRRLGLLVADGTREATFEALLPALRPELAGVGSLSVLVCTGTHEPRMPENQALVRRLRDRLAAADLAADVLVHDARREPFLDLGRTARGTPVLVNAALGECDVLLAVSNMKNHYFAGYSNPVKYVIPGVAAVETARANHSLTFEESSTFGRHPWHPRPERRDNPLAADMVEAFELAVGTRPHFAVVAVGTPEGLVWAGAGPSAEVSGRGMEVVDRVAGLELAPARFLVVSPGGHPHDESLYTAQRALELTRAAVRDGGEVLFLARCANGVGSESARRNFFEPLARPLDEVCRRPAGEYVMYSHKSYKFARYLAGLARVHMVTALPAAEVESIHLRPAGDAQSVLDEWGRRAEPGDEVTFIDDASRVAVRAPA